MFSFLTHKFSSIFSTVTGKGYLSQENLQEAIMQVRIALLEADVPVCLVDTFIEQVTTQAIGKKVVSTLKPADQFIKIVHDALISFLSGGTPETGTSPFSFQLPATVMVF